MPFVLIAYARIKYFVFAVSPVIVLVNIADPGPSFVFVESMMVGLLMVLHMTPFEVMSSPPLEIIFPPVITV
jgi:hypothetical protein